uniref:Esterase n=1 Tax=Amphora coffeiformis TaxID=265554 RepID=A0A7S3LCX0_9STRA|mmetsp:Transcript_25145/g.47749  ORF Transcript_25145/g.47749 Transcript_25145/m.47749 type:complete len:353 (+) Transcript_25145:89-1147(+)
MTVRVRELRLLLGIFLFLGTLVWHGESLDVEAVPRKTRRFSAAPPAKSIKKKILHIPRRELTPPFPDGLCGGELITLDDNLPSNNLLLPSRPIKVWLPPGYDPQKKYTTLYCHDGQNAVSDEDSWTGRSWRLTGALTRLADHGLLESLPIVVLLPSMDGDLIPGMRRRHLEYGDVNIPFAQAHADFVALTIKPLVDARFATCPDKSFAIGSSLGGQAALHLNMRHPDKFHGAACLSPCFNPGILSLVTTKGKELLYSKKVYLDIGGDLGDRTVPFFDIWDHTTEKHPWNPGYFWLDTSLQPAVQSMCSLLEKAQVDYVYHEIPGGRHNERAWSLRIDKPLRYLLGKDEDSKN